MMGFRQAVRGVVAGLLFSLLCFCMALAVSPMRAFAWSPDRLVLRSEAVTIQVRIFDGHRDLSVDNHIPTAELMKAYLEELTSSYEKDIPIHFSSVPEGCFSEDKDVFMRFGERDLYLRVDVFHELDQSAPEIRFRLCRQGYHRTARLPDDDLASYKNSVEHLLMFPACRFSAFSSLESYVFCQTKYRLHLLGLGLEPYSSQLKKWREEIGVE